MLRAMSIRSPIDHIFGKRHQLLQSASLQALGQACDASACLAKLSRPGPELRVLPRPPSARTCPESESAGLLQYSGSGTRQRPASRTKSASASLPLLRCGIPPGGPGSAHPRFKFQAIKGFVANSVSLSPASERVAFSFCSWNGPMPGAGFRRILFFCFSAQVLGGFAHFSCCRNAVAGTDRLSGTNLFHMTRSIPGVVCLRAALFAGSQRVPGQLAPQGFSR